MKPAKKAILGILTAISILSAGCAKQGSIDYKVREFLKSTDVSEKYYSLKINEVKNLSRDYVKVYAQFETDAAGHPLNSSEKRAGEARELHNLEMIIDEKPTDGSPYKVVYARDSHSWIKSKDGKELAPEYDWNYITGAHLEPNHDFDPSTPERDILWNGTRYYPVVYIKFPEISDYEKNSIAMIGQADGYEIWGWYDSRDGSVQHPPSQQVIIIPEGTGFYLWSKR
ncbi:MAG: hypothetical protein QW471_04735 [Candidatus Woesearchaeota archaeon]